MSKLLKKINDISKITRRAAFSDMDLQERVGAVLVFLDLLLHVGEGGTAGDLGDVVEFAQEFGFHWRLSFMH